MLVIVKLNKVPIQMIYHDAYEPYKFEVHDVRHLFKINL